MTDHTYDTNSNGQPLRLKLTAVVHYDRNGTSADELKRLLKAAINHAHDNGMLTADSDAEVGLYDVRVEDLGPESLLQRATLAREVYTTVEHGTESFEADHLGADFAYVLGAILRGDSGCEWDRDRPFVRLLRELFADEHPVWRYVHVDETDE